MIQHSKSGCPTALLEVLLLSPEVDMAKRDGVWARSSDPSQQCVDTAEFPKAVGRHDSDLEAEVAHSVYLRHASILASVK